jgi:hypothetical protein
MTQLENWRVPLIAGPAATARHNVSSPIAQPNRRPALDELEASASPKLARGGKRKVRVITGSGGCQSGDRQLNLKGRPLF